ncbi:hypothetical protein FPV67DRAFT_1487410 [Lyophyllum atratum]|nr:hypothetical protein FPV67DRAFT_1487410 [Lyophyllum atratum]
MPITLNRVLANRDRSIMARTRAAKKSTGSKLSDAINAIRSSGFRSTNHFIQKFYDSEHAVQSLRHQEGKSYGPAKLMDLWTQSVPSGSEHELHLAITRKAAQIMVKESTTAYHDKTLRFSSSGLDIPYLTTDFGIKTIQQSYAKLLPCLSFLLHALLTAENDYERRNDTEKMGKEKMAGKLVVVIISMLLFFRNRATNAFQLVMGVFLASSGASRRIIDTFNHMGLSVSYQTVQNALKTLSEDAKLQARNFVTKSGRLWGVVYDNINFTLRTASQRIDSGTRQLNATTIAVFSLPVHFTLSVYSAALSIVERKKLAGARRKLKRDDLLPTAAKQEQVMAAFKHAIRTILLTHTPGRMRRKRKTKTLRKHTQSLKPCIRQLGHDKTEFFPLPALNEEEASVPGTIRVVEKIFTSLLGLACELVEVELRLLVGDWLTIRNLRLMKEEREDERRGFLRFDWVQEVAMPFHFQLNAMYCLCRTHLGLVSHENPSSLEHHRNLLRRSKLDLKKPEYNKAKELVTHSLIARILDCARLILKKNSVDDLKSWVPTCEEFEELVIQIAERYTTTAAAHDALEFGDEVLAHSILFIRDALFFWEFCDAVRDADVGRMWVVYDFWVFMFRGAGCHNYRNELLEMKAQFEYEFPPLLRELVERTWLVNRWGKKGRSIPTDLYLEHNNGFTKNMFAAMGSCASIEHVQTKSSACVEVLRTLSHEVSTWFGVRDFHRGRKEVSIDGDLTALCLDISVHAIHTRTRERHIPGLKTTSKQSGSRKKKKSGVYGDVLEDGLENLTEKSMFEHWMARTGSGGTDLYDDEGGYLGDSDLTEGINPVFADPDGQLDVDTAMDPEFPECAFSNVDISTDNGDN